MAKDIATIPTLNAPSSSATVYVEDNGVLGRVTMPQFSELLSKDDNQMTLRQVAWGIPLREDISSQDWGLPLGNTAIKREYESRIGRYLVAADGRAAKLSATDSTKYADGTTLDESKGQMMVIAPNLYFKVTRDPSQSYDVLWLSPFPIGGHRVVDNNSDYICIGAYVGSIASNGALCSRRGASAAHSRTINVFWNAAQVNGSDWGLVSYDQVRWLTMMGLGYQATDTSHIGPNLQDRLGAGLGGAGGDGSWERCRDLATGQTVSLGDSCGKIAISAINGSATAAGACSVSLFGVEDWWSKIWQFVQGVYFIPSSTQGHAYQGNRMPSQTELDGTPASGSRSIQRSLETNGSYIKKLQLGEHFDVFAKQCGGSSAIYYGDGSWSGGAVALWGGPAIGGSQCGLVSAASSDAWSGSNSIFGARLAYYGKLTFTDGRQI